MAKAKSKNVIVKLISTAKTGITRTLLLPRQVGIVNQIKYDPIVKRHVLFVEAKKRKMGTQKKPLDFHRGAFDWKKK
ncbi:unnamed protein product [Kuraishia capsulata CBS 1993]|uniref:Large ribosomal subunit protein bL33m n=1 Tax=Kuraishia capsulata CBS 1993 TaxID=1382522 RepID=W6MMG6_9ASCO|nr:uncharacterized protein KUCA_T00003720001 [Kuraishia capsulata CBS 1993]CDK27741.1 unnamed protein product [Kuraishia capsulata CBS 1993]